MSPRIFLQHFFVFGVTACSWAVEVKPAAQHFQQEVASHYGANEGLPAGSIQLVTCPQGQTPFVFASGKWFHFVGGRWALQTQIANPNDQVFLFPGETAVQQRIPVPWREVIQVLYGKKSVFVATHSSVTRLADGKSSRLAWLPERRVNQVAIDGTGLLWIASSAGLFRQIGEAWEKVDAIDTGGRNWTAQDVLGVCYSGNKIWVATRAGVGCRSDKSWLFYEGKDGLPWNDFTRAAAGAHGEVWFATHLGAVRFDGAQWQYKQGPAWLPNDDVSAVVCDSQGRAWFATAAGVGCIGRREMTLAQKADLFETEIENYVKRTPYGFVAEAYLKRPADKSSADPQDSDNDGLWTAMYGAGECFAYAATHDAKAKRRATQAFEALRFLQKVTQDCDHAPPKGYIARTIRPATWPDPNIGRLAGDLEEQKRDKLWKAYEPRWPKSADGKWFWKSDTSSDELDGHFFFYPLYFDFCADTQEERERVREVVRDITDHLIAHNFCLVDFDGKPTRWGVYGPDQLNHEPYWWAERGLKSLSILCYLSAAAHVTGDSKYDKAAKELIELHSYAHNAMNTKLQHGPGSGNQSDDEMAFMCYYGLLRCSRDEGLKSLVRYSFFQYWVNEEPEMNPFFNFAFAAQNLGATVESVWGPLPVSPWAGWQQDSMSTLYGFPLDRLNWPHRNSHRLDVIGLPRVRSSDLDTPDAPRQRGYLVNGKVLPVENRHFNHWNTDPWQLDYGGDGGELAAGTVFLLPYYMGMYHGFVEKP
ncbi:MAG TPA: hypothetical protein VKY92_00350 [Verrucomicrobiae bacterium]|nr:hypothetical protein [Verrucomicrobiae bacterium]